jgi:hypothetical protein
MALFSVIRRISREDLAKRGEVPAWIDELLQPLNDFMDQTVSTLRGGITFSNISHKEVKFRFTSGTESQFSVPSNRRVAGIQVVEALNKTITGYGFTRKSNGNIGITVKFDGGGDADCNVKILLE